MVERKRLLLFADQDEKFQPVFATREEYEDFRIAYSERMGPIFRRQAEARARSEMKARYHLVD